MTKILFIGDPHFKVNNVEICDIFIDRCLEVLNQNPGAICVVAGDILDTHERLHQVPFNKAINFIKRLTENNKVFVLVGNHDYENNQQFLTDKHWMNCLKYWKSETCDLTVVDRTIEYDGFLFVPYVPVGRFIEALNTNESDWRNAKCIFAHQEFKGCSLSNTLSENGDKWLTYYPLVISGHIHKAHKPQENIIYPGSVIQHNFGEENNETGILLIDFSEDKPLFTTYEVQIPKLSTIELDCSEFENYVKTLNLKPLEKRRIICKGNEDDFKRIKKSQTYANIPIGVTVNFAVLEKTEPNDFKFETFDEVFELLLKEKEEAKVFFDQIMLDKNFTDILNEFEFHS